MDPGSQPRSGSYTAQLATAVPAISCSITSACASALDASDSAMATTFTGTRGPGETSRPISSATIAMSTIPFPEMLSPPIAAATSIDVQPSSAPRRHHSRSKPTGPAASSRTTASGVSFSRKSLVVSRNRACSCVRLYSTVHSLLRGYAPLASISAESFGTTLKRSPTTPKSVSSKIGASGSLLTATITFEVCMPARCWMAPEMPIAT